MKFTNAQDVKDALVKAEQSYYRRMEKYDWFDKDERPFSKSLSMRLLKRTGSFTSSNCTFDPLTMRAYSYGWWRFVDLIDGKVVYNTYRYSPSTGKHQNNVSNMLETLGIKVDVEVSVPKGLQDLESGIREYESNIQTLMALIQNPRSRKNANIERATTIRAYQTKIAELNSLIKAKGE